MSEVPSTDNIELGRIRRYFAEEVRVTSGLRSEALVEALGSLPRERFLGPGPWLVRGIDMEMGAQPRPTPDADPRHVYHNVSIAIDLPRQLYNGQPGAIALWIDALELKPGDRVLHIGCATGYYTAIMAHMVGKGGSVTAVEIDPDLARRARENLADMPSAEVRQGDGTTGLPRGLDAVLVNAGATHPTAAWLDALGESGRLVVPLTIAMDPSSPNIGKGGVLLVTGAQKEHSARFISVVAIYSCAGVRDDSLQAGLRTAMMKGNWGLVRRLRRDAHVSSAGCWLHGADFCLSTQ